MKHFFQVFRVDMKRAVLSWGFLLGVVLTLAGLYFSANRDLRYNSDVLGVFIYVFRYNNGQSMMVLAATFAFSAGFCWDYNSKMIYPFLIRSNPKTYSMAKVVSCALAGGLCVTLGAALFLGICRWVSAGWLPTDMEYLAVSHGGSPFGHGLLEGRIFPFFAWNLYVIFLSSAFWAVLGLCVSSYMPNKYIAYCAPFIGSFMLTQFGLIFHLPNWINPIVLGKGGDFVGSVGNNGMTFWVTTVVFFGCILVCGILFVRNCQRRIAND